MIRKKTPCVQTPNFDCPHSSGPLAQLAERLNGIEEVSGSNPLGSTTLKPSHLAAVFCFPDLYWRRRMTVRKTSARPVGGRPIGRMDLNAAKIA